MKPNMFRFHRRPIQALQKKEADDFAFELMKKLGIFSEDISYQGKVNQTVSRGEFAYISCTYAEVG